MQFTKKQKVAGAVVAGAAVISGAGVAYAYWTTGGTGDSSAATGTNTAVTVTQTSSPAGLVPGGAAQAVNFKITNPASTPQYVTSVSFSIKNANGTAWSAQADATKPACTASDFTLVQPTVTPADLPSGDTQYNSAGTGGTGASIALNDAGTNQDNCKSVTVPLHFVAS